LNKPRFTTVYRVIPCSRWYMLTVQAFNAFRCVSVEYLLFTVAYTLNCKHSRMGKRRLFRENSLL